MGATSAFEEDVEADFLVEEVEAVANWSGKSESESIASSSAWAAFISAILTDIEFVIYSKQEYALSLKFFFSIGK